MKKWLLMVVALLMVAVAGYIYFTATKTIEVQEASPFLQVNQGAKDIPTLLAQGQFMASVHEVHGKALLIRNGSSNILRFEDFETVNGPDLHIWLASSLGAEDYVDLGPIKATKGNVNYAVPADVDAEKYNKVLVWCVPFKVLFGYAELG